MKISKPIIHYLILIPAMFFSGILSAGCNPFEKNETINEAKSLELTEAFPNLEFTRPLDLQHPGDGSNRLFVVEQRGIISVFKNSPDVSNKKIVLDITDRVEDSGNEEGLLGLAFHPDFDTNGYFFVNYTASSPDDRTVIARYEIDPANPDKALKKSEKVILTYSQPYSNHNGGDLAFGPHDGYLYIGVGDGGSGGDPQGNGQNLETLLGTILRIDIDNPQNGENYGIPNSNPFANNNEGYKEEIFAYGLRNPWRFSFDPNTFKIWTGDVGQNAYEEISLVENGGNYGWNIQEGFHCYSPSSNCDKEGLEQPIWEYSQKNGDRSVTGGYVYQGKNVPALKGNYIYADYASGRIWSLDFSNMDNPVNEELLDTSLGIASFGMDANKELYICAFDGKIYKFKNS